MGKNADKVQERMEDVFRQLKPGYDWDTEYSIEDTPVDISGLSGDSIFLVELEWRRADPADNIAKIFRHIEAENLEEDQVKIVQIFTAYYDLKRGGVSSKRNNAEFVGKITTQSIQKVTYHAVDFDLAPPKEDEELSKNWERKTRETCKKVLKNLE